MPNYKWLYRYRDINIKRSAHSDQLRIFGADLASGSKGLDDYEKEIIWSFDFAISGSFEEDGICGIGDDAADTAKFFRT